MNSNIGEVILPSISGKSTSSFSSGWNSSYNFTKNPGKYTYNLAEDKTIESADFLSDSEEFWTNFAKNFLGAAIGFASSYATQDMSGGGKIAFNIAGTGSLSLFTSMAADLTKQEFKTPNTTVVGFSNVSNTNYAAGVIDKKIGSYASLEAKTITGAALKNDYIDLSRKSYFFSTTKDMEKYWKYLHDTMPDDANINDESSMELEPFSTIADTNLSESDINNGVDIITSRVDEYSSTVLSSTSEYAASAFGLEYGLSVGGSALSALISKGEVEVSDLKLGRNSLKSMTKTVGNVASLFFGKTAGAGIKAAFSFAANYVCLPFEEMFEGDEVAIEAWCGAATVGMAVGAISGLAFGISIAGPTISAALAAGTLTLSCLGPIGWAIMIGAVVGYALVCLFAWFMSDNPKTVATEVGKKDGQT